MRIHVRPGLADREVVEIVEQWEERREQTNLRSWVRMHRQPTERLTVERERAKLLARRDM